MNGRGLWPIRTPAPGGFCAPESAVVHDNGLSWDSAGLYHFLRDDLNT